ncbi:MAG: hypothetical protein Kow00108_22790 [Calditrichia bacterium]
MNTSFSDPDNPSPHSGIIFFKSYEEDFFLDELYTSHDIIHGINILEI